jgi:hypothetical protein
MRPGRLKKCLVTAIVSMPVLATSVANAQTQSSLMPGASTNRIEPQRLKIPANIFLNTAPMAARRAQPTARQCRAGRRALLGAAIGAGAAIPVGVLLHQRFTNEGANGTGAAASIIGTAAAFGALIGWGSCH